MISSINSGDCTERSAIWSEIKRVITKSHDREAGVRFAITSLISDQNCTTRSAISTLLHSFLNLKQDTPPAFLPVLLRRGSIATSEQNQRTYLFKVYRYLTNGEDNGLVCA